MASKTDGQFRLPVRISDSRKGRTERQSVPLGPPRASRRSITPWSLVFHHIDTVRVVYSCACHCSEHSSRLPRVAICSPLFAALFPSDLVLSRISFAHLPCFCLVLWLPEKKQAFRLTEPPCSREPPVYIHGSCPPTLTSPCIPTHTTTLTLPPFIVFNCFQRITQYEQQQPQRTTTNKRHRQH